MYVMSFPCILLLHHPQYKNRPCCGLSWSEFLLVVGDFYLWAMFTSELLLSVCEAMLDYVHTLSYTYTSALVDNLYYVHSDTMEAKLAAMLACVAFVCLARLVTSEPLEDQLPDTTGLFFGKRSSNPNLSSLLFNRRSYSQPQPGKFSMADARRVCRTVQLTCARWGLDYA